MKEIFNKLKLGKYASEGVKLVDYFKQPIKMLVTRKGVNGEREQEDEIGSIYGGFLTIIAFTCLFLNGLGTYTDMMAGSNDNINK